MSLYEDEYDSDWDALDKDEATERAYAIGVAEPVSIMVNTFGTAAVAEEKIEQIIPEFFELKPAGIIKSLDLLRPIYRDTAAYGHFGRSIFSWEKTDKADALKDALL
jgi:S-adenosylmethionine synthetase